MPGRLRARHARESGLARMVWLSQRSMFQSINRRHGTRRDHFMSQISSSSLKGLTRPCSEPRDNLGSTLSVFAIQPLCASRVAPVSRSLILGLVSPAPEDLSAHRLSLL